MRRACIVLVTFAVGCISAKPYHWEQRGSISGPQTMCSCDGATREPRPDEASSPNDPRIVLGMCEGRVHDCRPFSGRGWGAQRNQLD